MDSIDIEKVVVDENGEAKVVEPEQVIPAKEIPVDVEVLERDQSDDRKNLEGYQERAESFIKSIAFLQERIAARQIILDDIYAKKPAAPVINEDLPAVG